MGPGLQTDRAAPLRPVVSPASDPSFATSKLHGEVAQMELLRQVVKLCPQKRMALDVGAHIGLWSRNLAASFENVLAFEPVHENAECFRQNVEGLKNVWLAEFALGDERRAAELVRPLGGNSGMWFAKLNVPVAEDAVPNMHTIDQMPLIACDLIKIDTEGFEGRVIRGGAETITTHKPVIVFEDNGLGPKYYGADWVDPKPLLKQLGYYQRFTWRKDRVWLPK
jgi:FkbM family methyltransferase